MATKWGDRENRRRDILVAGRALLTEKGYAALQMRDVAKGAGISPGTVYTYFATKEALYATLYAERLEEFVATVEPRCADTEDLEELFVLIATEYLEMYRVYGRELNIWAVLAGEVELSEQSGGQLITAAARAYDLMRHTVERLDLGDDPGMTVTVLWSVITGLADHFTSVRRHLHPHDWDDTVRFTARTLIAGGGRSGSPGRAGQVTSDE
ncbi:TetR family transcriptional regulator [Nocardia brasiliensis]|uniref:TetR family transcriptional regulator n=1 Tax=Nocardia brasiliensis TaxID=37326 RepID=A0A6G9XUI3_NOCBR|nr:TetR/AcrR family transcriptional regulator [Nocardia brasiliensis]QIS04567.1 TetR family transcriptional regulator [Nocardia brasiliensis]